MKSIGHRYRGYPIRFALAGLFVCLLAPAASTDAAIVTTTVFTESFESPDVTGYLDASQPSSGWIVTNSTAGFGWNRRGMHNEDSTQFTTPYGEQGFELWYGNAALTTNTTLVPDTLTADTTYTVTFNVAEVDPDGSALYLIELVAFTGADSRTLDDSGVVLGSASGTVSTSDMSAGGSIIFTPDISNAHLGKSVAVRLRGQTSQEVVFDNVSLTTAVNVVPAPAALPAGLALLALTVRRRRHA